MDYRSFLSPRAPLAPLSPRAPLVLPYFGGTRVDAADRRFRVVAPRGGAEAPSAADRTEPVLEPGWWRFESDGRRAIPRERAAPVELGARPAVRGHWASGWVVASGRELGRIALPPEDEPPPLARVTARRWYSGELLLDSIDFEDAAEVSARAALEEQRPIAELRGVVPSLRAAFALALALAVARELRVPVSLRELAPYHVAIGDGGRVAVRALLDRLVAQRRAAEAAGRDARLRAAAAQGHARRRAGDPVERADAALEGAGARMLSARRLHGSQLEVRFIVDDVRLSSIVAMDTLQVLDAGLCLAGADRMVTLDSLPSVVREAIRTHSLNLTRHD